MSHCDWLAPRDIHDTCPGTPYPSAEIPVSGYTRTYVVAEDAPLGVQLWPTTAPEHAPNFTLAAVEVIRRTLRDTSGFYEHASVVWTYESGTTRSFVLGEKVAVETPPGHHAPEGTATP